MGNSTAQTPVPFSSQSCDVAKFPAPGISLSNEQNVSEQFNAAVPAPAPLSEVSCLDCVDKAERCRECAAANRRRQSAPQGRSSRSDERKGTSTSCSKVVQDSAPSLEGRQPASGEGGGTGEISGGEAFVTVPLHSSCLPIVEPLKQHTSSYADDCSDGSDESRSSIIVESVTIGKFTPVSGGLKDGPAVVRVQRLMHSVSTDQDEEKLKKHIYWAYTTTKGGPVPRNGTYDHRQVSVLRSCISRFPSISSHYQRLMLKISKIADVIHPTFRYTLQNTGCQAVLVEDSQTRSRFLDFCKNEMRVAIDTEAAPSPFKKYIDLIQISNHDTAFLCPVRQENFGLLEDIASTLFLNTSKTVLQFGNDDVNKFLDAIGIRIQIHCKLIDVQGKLTKKAAKPPNLPDCVREIVGGCLVLSKAWTISGWDNVPLHPEQVEYASLDVLLTFRIANGMR